MPSLQQIIDCLEELAPLRYQESYDNSGLIVGDRKAEITGVLITLDCLESVVAEAIDRKCNLILAHHPIVFSGLKTFTGKNYIERVIMQAIKHDIAIYAAHTNLDNMRYGVNHRIATKLGLSDLQILEPQGQTLKQLYVYVPLSHAETVREAMFNSGAGRLGNYSSCSYNVQGTGTYKPGASADPYSGRIGVLQNEPEIKIEVLVSPHCEAAVLKAMKATHPYEEIAYGLIDLSNKDPYTGAGMVGNLPDEMLVDEFLHLLSKTMQTGCIRHTAQHKKTVSRVALCGGSGSFLLQRAIQTGADVFVSADFKYHQFFDAEGKIVIADIGHYESEQFTSEIFYEVLSNKFHNFALHLTAINTNPIKYYY